MPMFEDTESESREIKAEDLGEATASPQPRGLEGATDFHSLHI